MDLLGGYGNSDSEEEEDAQPAAPKKPKTSQPPAQGTASSDGSTAKRKVVDFSKLPVRRPVVFDDSKGEAEEAPLRKAAELESLRGGALNLLAALPPPKVTLGVDVDQNSAGSRIDLSEVKFERSQKQVEISSNIFHTTGSIMRGVSAPEVKESGEVPEDVMNHPMFRNDATAGAGGDRPSMEELQQMKNMKFMSVKPEDVQDPDWYLHNQMAKAEPGRNTGKVSLEVSMYEQKTWEKTTHANPSKNQKRKHQINWLAHEAMEKEAELLDRAASSRLTKAQTSMKYGW